MRVIKLTDNTRHIHYYLQDGMRYEGLNIGSNYSGFSLPIEGKWKEINVNQLPKRIKDYVSYRINQNKTEQEMLLDSI